MLPVTPRAKKALVAFLGFLLAAGGLLAFRYWRRPVTDPFAFLPPQAGLLAGADVAELRKTLFWLPLAKFLLPEELPHDEAYDRFVAESGFAPERDLDRLALALIPGSPRPALVAVLTARFDRARLVRYLLAHGARVQKHADVNIYRVSLDATREVWLAAFNENILLVANGPLLEAALDGARNHRAAREHPTPLLSTATVLAMRNNAIWAVADLKLWPDLPPIPRELIRPVKLAWFEGRFSSLALELKATAACPSAQEAFLVESNMHGLRTIAMAALRAQHPRQPQWEMLARDLQIVRRDSEVDLTLKIGLDTLGQLFAAGEKKEPAPSR